MTKRGLDLAELIFEAEPDAALGDPAAVDRVTQALAKVTGAILSTTLVRNGEDAFAIAVQRMVSTVVGQEARRIADLMRSLQWGDAGLCA